MKKLNKVLQELAENINFNRKYLDEFKLSEYDHYFTQTLYESVSKFFDDRDNKYRDNDNGLELAKRDLKTFKSIIKDYTKQYIKKSIKKYQKVKYIIKPHFIIDEADYIFLKSLKKEIKTFKTTKFKQLDKSVYGGFYSNLKYAYLTFKELKRIEKHYKIQS